MTAIEALRKAAKGKGLNKAKAESDIARCIEAYRTGYRATDLPDGQRLLADVALKRVASRKTIAEGKVHMSKMRRHISKLREDAEGLLNRDHMDTLFFAGSVYEDNKWWPNDDTPGYEAAVKDMSALIHTLDHIDNRMKVVTSRRIPSSRKTNHVQRLTIDLANVYREHTGREPASGTHGTDERDGSPFVLFVREVLHQCAPKEAKREALGQSVYMWLREDREFRSFITYMESPQG